MEDMISKDKYSRCLSVVLHALLILCIVSCGHGQFVQQKSALPKTSVRKALSYNDAQRLKAFYYEAINQQTKNNFDAAFDLLQKCLSIDPQASEVYFSLAAYYAELQNDSMAMYCMNKAVELSPSNDTYLERLAITHINSRQFAEASNVYEKLFQNNRDRSDVLNVLLQLYNQQREYDKMLETLDRIERIEGNSEQLALARMRVYAQQGDKDNEFHALKSLSEQYPHDMNYRIMTGNWLLQNGQDEEALNEYNYVLSQEPDNQAVKLSLIDYYRTVGSDSLANDLQEKMLINPDTEANTKLTLMRKVVADNEQAGGDSTEVLDLFQRILAEPQRTSDMTELYAAYMSLKKMPQDTINNVLRDVLKIAPDNSGIRLQLLQSLWEKKAFDEVISQSKAGVAYNPDNMLFYYFLGMAYSQQDKHDEALETFRQGVTQINEDSNKEIVSDFYAIMGDLLHEKGKIEEAFAAYDSCLHWKSDNVTALNNYAYYLSVLNRDLSKAEQMSYKTIKAEPANATYLDTYAWILFMQERYAEAKIYIDQTLQHDKEPSDVVLEHAGDIYAMNKDFDKAVEYWNKSLKAGNTSKLLLRKIKSKKYIEK